MRSPLLYSVLEIADRKLAEAAEKQASFSRRYLENLDYTDHKKLVDLSALSHHLGQAKNASARLYDLLVQLMDATEVGVGNNRKLDEKRLPEIWTRPEVQELYREIFQHLGDFARSGHLALAGDTFTPKESHAYDFLIRLEEWLRDAANDITKADINPRFRYKTPQVIYVLDNVAELDHQLDRMLRNPEPQWEDIPNFIAWNVRGHLRGMLQATSLAPMGDHFPLVKE